MHRIEALRRLNGYRVVQLWQEGSGRPINKWEIRPAGLRTPLATIELQPQVYACDLDPLVTALIALCEKPAPIRASGRKAVRR